MKVILDRPGVRACGEYRAGEIYDIKDEKVAKRLIDAKGFRRATKDDEKKGDAATNKTAESGSAVQSQEE